jgi:ribosomal protein S19E (S16A)
LTLEQMQWWMTRMRSIIRKVQKTWPDTPIVYRKLHRPTDPGAGCERASV